jgi:chromate transporter
MPADAQTSALNSTREVVPAPFAKFCGYFLWLGTTGFGGPIALAGYMQRDLVERRSWVSREDYLEGLALAQLAPGPLAARLFTWAICVPGLLGLPRSDWRSSAHHF